MRVSCQAPARSPLPLDQPPRHSTALSGTCWHWLGAMGLSRRGLGRWVDAGLEEAKATGAGGKRWQELLWGRRLTGALLQHLPPMTSVQKRDLPVPGGRGQRGWHTGAQAAPRMAASLKGAQSLVGPALAGVSWHSTSCPRHCFTAQGLGREGRRALCELNTASATPPTPAIIF